MRQLGGSCVWVFGGVRPGRTGKWDLVTRVIDKATLHFITYDPPRDRYGSGSMCCSCFVEGAGEV